MDSNDDLSRAISALPYSYKASSDSATIKADYEKHEGKGVSVAGRVMAIRKAGKLAFADILDAKGKIQVCFDYSILKERFDSAKRLNPGDIIGAKGEVFKTKAGEVSIKVSSYEQLAKAVNNLPDKWHGIQDAETRYRKRHLDLIMNQDSRAVFMKRSRMVSAIRAYLDSEGFTEFETPIIQPLYGGADAEPFKVFVNTLAEEDYLRISNELYLKRLIIGGMERVYEIYKAFRNEDIDTTHSPEFTMIEIYQAYTDYNGMMRLTESLISCVAKSVLGGTEMEWEGKTIRFSAPFKTIKYIDSISEKLGADLSKMDGEEVIKTAEKKGIKFEKGKRNAAHAYDKLFSLLVQPELVQPTFVIDFPKSSSPLTREKRGDPNLVERFEMYIRGMEIANSYSELNNPIVQKENFMDEMKKMEEGDKEAEPLDMDFVEAMEYGMPPTGGIGIGIDRLAMVMTGAKSIKDVILFPMEKRRPQR